MKKYFLLGFFILTIFQSFAQKMTFYSKQYFVSELDSNSEIRRDKKTSFVFDLTAKTIEIKFYDSNNDFQGISYSYYSVEENKDGTYTFSVIKNQKAIVIGLDGNTKSISIVDDKYYRFKILQKEEQRTW